MRSNPFITLGMMYLYGTALFTIGFRISERPLERDNDEI
jgi:hypothetical protein